MPAALHRSGEFRVWETFHRTTSLAREVGMEVGSVVFAPCLVPRDSTHVVGHASEIDLDQLEKVTVERRLVPVLTSDRLDNFAMGERFVRADEESENRHAGSGCSQPCIMDALFGLIARELEVLHPKSLSRCACRCKRGSIARPVLVIAVVRTRMDLHGDVLEVSKVP